MCRSSVHWVADSITRRRWTGIADASASMRGRMSAQSNWQCRRIGTVNQLAPAKDWHRQPIGTGDAPASSVGCADSALPQRNSTHRYPPSARPRLDDQHLRSTSARWLDVRRIQPGRVRSQLHRAVGAHHSPRTRTGSHFGFDTREEELQEQECREGTTEDPSAPNDLPTASTAEFVSHEFKSSEPTGKCSER